MRPGPAPGLPALPRPVHATSIQPGQSRDWRSLRRQRRCLQLPCPAPGPWAWLFVSTERAGAKTGSPGPKLSRGPCSLAHPRLAAGGSVATCAAAARVGEEVAGSLDSAWATSSAGARPPTLASPLPSTRARRSWRRLPVRFSEAGHRASPSLIRGQAETCHDGVRGDSLS